MLNFIKIISMKKLQSQGYSVALTAWKLV